MLHPWLRQSEKKQITKKEQSSNIGKIPNLPFQAVSGIKHTM